MHINWFYLMIKTVRLLVIKFETLDFVLFKPIFTADYSTATFNTLMLIKVAPDTVSAEQL